MKRPKLLAIDIDGTLLNSAGELTVRTETALKAAMSQGIQVILATGRMCCSGLVYAQRLGLTAPCVFYNGAMITNPVTQEVYFKQEISEDYVAQVTDFFHKNGWYMQKYIDDTLCVVDENDEHCKYYVSIAKVKPKSLGEKFWTLKTTSTKLLACSDNVEELPEMLAKTEQKFGKQLYVASSWKRFVELMHPEVNKARSVERAAALLGITQPDVACFGDSGNDAEMLAWAGFGVAMGNSANAIKQAADTVAKSNDEDGLAQFVEQFLD